MTIFGFSPGRFAVNVAGGMGGAFVADVFVLPALANSFPRFFTPSGDSFGVDDAVAVALVLIGALAANKAFSGIKG